MEIGTIFGRLRKIVDVIVAFSLQLFGKHTLPSIIHSCKHVRASEQVSVSYSLPVFHSSVSSSTKMDINSHRHANRIVMFIKPITGFENIFFYGVQNVFVWLYIF